MNKFIFIFLLFFSLPSFSQTSSNGYSAHSSASYLGHHSDWYYDGHSSSALEQFSYKDKKIATELLQRLSNCKYVGPDEESESGAFFQPLLGCKDGWGGGAKGVCSANVSCTYTTKSPIRSLNNQKFEMNFEGVTCTSGSKYKTCPNPFMCLYSGGFLLFAKEIESEQEGQKRYKLNNEKYKSKGIDSEQ